MSSKEEGGWAPCSEGILSSTIKRARTKRRRANLLRIGGSTIVGLVVLFFAFSFFSQKSIELSCYQVVGLLPAYVAGELDEGSRRNVDKHLAGCSKCRKKLEEMKDARLVSRARFDVFLSPKDRSMGSRSNHFITVPLPIDR